MPPTAVVPPPAPPRRAVLARPVAWPWRAGQTAALVTFLALPVVALVAPALVLRGIWGVLVPVLPFTFLVSPALWRGICPLATLNAGGARLAPAATPPAPTTALAVGGLALFFGLVPARHLVFDHDAPVLAATAVAVGLAAVALGRRFPTRAGFCNGCCPILPVERLYGQHALLPLGRGRCEACRVCTPRGCLDLAEDKALAQVLGPARRSSAWLATPLGGFAAALPGFIAGYYQVPAGASVGHAYALPLGGAAAGALLVAALVLATQLRPTRALPALAALAVSLHAWFGAPVLAAGLGLPPGAAWGIRALAAALIGTWLARALGAAPRLHGA
ncbi:MAG: hypothetical protein NW201_13450 [Gemmatimonadales bacterium]|nr:hypothetical protein [Gemmatimonadales bacterium]